MRRSPLLDIFTSPESIRDHMSGWGEWEAACAAGSECRLDGWEEAVSLVSEPAERVVLESLHPREEGVLFQVARLQPRIREIVVGGKLHLTRECAGDVEARLGECAEARGRSALRLTRLRSLERDALKFNCVITHLDITSAGIGYEGAACLSQIISCNASMLCILAAENGIGDDGAESIENALTQNTSLLLLDLRDNGVGETRKVALEKTAGLCLRIQV